MSYIYGRRKMARIARKYLETEYYHIMVQGIERNYIFQEDYTDKKVIYKVAREIKSRCLVTNEKIYEFMGIKKTTFYKIMKKERKLDK